MSDDLTGKIIGWRTWKIDEQGLLRPMVMDGAAWTPGVNTAKCHNDGAAVFLGAPPNPPHEAPGHDCECGLYAYYEPHMLDPNLVPHHEIGGALLAWGETELHAKGFRAEHAEILCLVVPATPTDFSRKLAEHIAEKYGVPILSADRAEAYAMEFGRPVPSDLIPEPSSPGMIGGGLIGSSFRVHSASGMIAAGPSGLTVSVPLGTRRPPPPQWWVAPFNAGIGAFNVAAVALADGSWINAACAAVSFSFAGWFAALRRERS